MRKTKNWPIVLVLLFSLGTRLYRISTVPSVINGDESGSLVHPLQILYYPGLNIWTLTHDGSVSYLVYLPKAAVIAIFGLVRALPAVRLVTGFFSLGALLGFYLLVRKYVSQTPAVLATLLLSANVIFFTFSRAAWINMDSVFFGVWFFYLLDNYKPGYLGPLVACCAGLLFEYMGGRVFLACLPIFFTARAINDRSARPLGQMFLIAVLSLVIFLPQLAKIINNQSDYLRRARSVMITDFSPKTVLTQAGYVINGLIFFDPGTARLSIENQRLLPPNTSGLSPALVPIYLTGILLTAVKKGGNRFWFWPLALNLIFIQLPTALVPSWGRALPVYPVIFLFIAVGIEGILQKMKFKKVVIATAWAIAGIIIIMDITEYFGWVSTREFSRASEPVIQLADVPNWLAWQKKYAQESKFPFDAYYWQRVMLPSISPGQ